MTVHRFLVTAPEPAIVRFHLAVATYANALEVRGQTTFYTVFSSEAEEFLRAAKWADVSVQEIDGADETESYRTVRTGADGLLWSPS